VSAFDFTVTGGLDPAESSQAGQIIWLEDVLYIGSPSEDGPLTWTGTPTDTEDLSLLIDILSGNLLLEALNGPGVAITLRGEDTELNGQTMLVFESDIDLVTLLLTPQILTVLEDLLAALPADAAGAGGMGAGLEQLQGADLAGAIPLLSLLFTQDTFQTVLWVGAEDGLVHHVELWVDWVIDPSIIDPSQPPATFRFEVISDLDQHGNAPAIIAPENVTLQEELALDLGFGLEGILEGGAEAEALPLTEQFAIEERLSFGDEVAGQLTQSNPQDVWGFTASAGQVITITLRNADPESVLDTRLILRDPEGVELASNDDHGSNTEGLVFSDSILQTFTIPADGDYRIVATWLAPVRDGSYLLRLNLED
jgi:hypothetical protein